MSGGALALLSGGQDSTTALFWAKKHYDPVYALNIGYGQRHAAIERTAAHIIARMGEVKEFLTIDTSIFTQIGDSALLDESMDISASHEGNEGLPASFVPGRNIFFLTIAAAVAYKKKIGTIVIGACQTDYSGYPDCRAVFMSQMRVALEKGMERSFYIQTPLMNETKKGTVLMARTLPGCWEALKFSHTCYNGVFPPCGSCPACKLRAKGFRESGFTDPLWLRVVEG